MNYIKIAIAVLLLLSASRFIPHPPNFTSLQTLSFYIPAVFGLRFIPIVIIGFAFTDFVIGMHSTILFTWGSVILIGLISKYFNKSFVFRLSGVLTGTLIFFIVTNFGVWTLGSYGYNFEGLASCYILAIPFFGYSIISTLIYSLIIETIYKVYRSYTKNSLKI